MSLRFWIHIMCTRFLPECDYALVDLRTRHAPPLRNWRSWRRKEIFGKVETRAWEDSAYPSLSRQERPQKEH
jgi:hypothetical protein